MVSKITFRMTSALSAATEVRSTTRPAPPATLRSCASNRDAMIHP